MPDYALTQSEREEPSQPRGSRHQGRPDAVRNRSPRLVYQSPLSGCLTGEIQIYVVISAALPEHASVSTVPRGVSLRL
jgi:hypothetical protein